MKRWRTALLCGYVLMFFSEFMFVNRLDITLDWIPTTIAYTLMAYVLLAMMTHYRVRSVWAIFLAGAAYGWLLEGVVVQTMYANFPFYVPFTGLSWHALFDVVVGWYLVRRVLHAPRHRQTALLALGIGLFWGLWAIWTWAEENDVPSLATYATHVTVTSLPLIACYWQLDRLEPLAFQPHRHELRVLVGLLVLLFALVAIAMPVALAVLPPLMALILRALRQHRRRPSSPSIPLAYDRRVPPVRYALLGLMPLSAVLTYAACLALDVRIATNALVYVITVPLSVGLFVRALWTLQRAPAVPSVALTTTALDSPR